jgi:hypothetical protein
MPPSNLSKVGPTLGRLDSRCATDKQCYVVARKNGHLYESDLHPSDPSYTRASLRLMTERPANVPDEDWYASRLPQTGKEASSSETAAPSRSEVTTIRGPITQTGSKKST